MAHLPLGDVQAFGQNGTGKTHSLFGTAVEPGLVPQLTDGLLTALQQRGDRTSKVGVSYWELRHNDVVDLLRAEPLEAGSSVPNEFTAVEVRSMDDVAAVLVSFLGDAKSSLGDAESSLGAAKSSLGDAKSSLGDAESLLGRRAVSDAAE